MKSSGGLARPYGSVDEAIIPNNFADYVYGDESAATALKLALNVNTPETAEDARRKLLGVARVRYEKALSDQTPGGRRQPSASGS